MSDVEIIRDVGIVLSPLSHLVSGLAFKVNLVIAQNTALTTDEYKRKESRV